MTIQTTTNKILYTGDGATTVFSYNFRVDRAEDMAVYIAGVLTPTGWSISGLGNPAGGNVTFSVAPDDGDSVSLLREIAMEQLVDYKAYDPFPANVHEFALDKLTMVDQQLAEEISRAIVGNPDTPADVDTTLPTYDAGKGIMWDEVDKKMAVSNDNFNDIVSNAAASAAAAAASAGSAQGYATSADVSADLAAASAAEAAASALEQEYELSISSGDVNWNWADSVARRVALLSLDEAAQLIQPTNQIVGMSGVLRVTVDLADAELTLGGVYDWGDEGVPGLPTTLNSQYMLGFYCRDSSTPYINVWLVWKKTA